MAIILDADVIIRAEISNDDLIVTATALERASQVATFNGRHFSQVSGLTVIEP